MRPPFKLGFAFALAFVVFAGSSARADFINWAYSWTHTPSVVAADTGGTGGVTLTNHQGGTGSGASDVVVTELTTFSSATVNAPDHFTNKNYSLILDLTDSASHQSGMLTFNGTLNGTVSTTSANIKNTFIGPLTQHLDLGGNLYTITIGPYAAPGIPDAIQTGSISAHLSVQPEGPVGGGSGGGGSGGSTPPPAQGAPEPSTLLLACLGLSALGLAGWRRWARARTVAACPA
jgi:hypothetical protein